MRKLKVNYTWDLYHGPALIWTLLGPVMYMGVKWTGSTLVKIITCCLFITKPLSKLIDTDHQWARKNKVNPPPPPLTLLGWGIMTSKDMLSRFRCFQSRKCSWSSCLLGQTYVVAVRDELIAWVKGRLMRMGICLISKHIFMRDTSCCEKFCLNEFCHSGQANMYMPSTLTGLLWFHNIDN